MSITVMIKAAVRRSFLVLRMRPFGYRGSSSGSPLTSGMTATPVSKPESPRASLGNNRSASPIMTSGLP